MDAPKSTVALHTGRKRRAYTLPSGQPQSIKKAKHLQSVGNIVTSTPPKTETNEYFADSEQDIEKTPAKPKRKKTRRRKRSKSNPKAHPTADELLSDLVQEVLTWRRIEVDLKRRMKKLTRDVDRLEDMRGRFGTIARGLLDEWNRDRRREKRAERSNRI